MQSLSTFSQLTAEELVHLHRHKKYRRIRTRSISVQVSSSDGARIQLVCSNEDWNLKINFNAQTESVAVVWCAWTEVECLPAPLCIFSILHWASQQASANVHEMGLFFYTCSPWGALALNKEAPLLEDVLVKSPFLLPWLLTAQMHLQLLMNHTKIHTYIHGLLHHRGRLYFRDIMIRCLA